MKTQHTPGPWKNVGKGYDTDITDGDGDGALIIATVYDCNIRQGVQEANARLIAAAPDLLDALEAINALIPEWVKETHNTESGKIRAVVHAAIRKARGEA